MSLFNQIPSTHVKSNTFDLSHDVKMSTRMGKITPIMTLEILPGDSMKISGNAFVRLAPMIAPVMHRADVYLHYFYVPNRILWENWEDFITGGEDGNNNSAHPYMELNTTTVVNGTLADYMGIPTDADVGAGKSIEVNAFPFAAYQKIYDDYFRDENLITRIRPRLTDGDNGAQLAMLSTMRQRAWGHDYFTAALPWTQRGPEALLPLLGTAELAIKFDGQGGSVKQSLYDATTPFAIVDGSTPRDLYQADPGGGDFIHYTNATPATTQAFIDISESHEVDLSSATGTTIIELRRALKLQEWLEKNAVGGARYIEQLTVHFGVSSDDKRLQRPEYIGGYSSPIKFSEVLQTESSISGQTPQGTMAGHGISVGGSTSYNYSAKEHGYIIGLMSIIPKTAYEQGIPKHFSRRDKLDYAWPSFAHIGEQAILNQELYLTGVKATDEATFGYTPRYAEYKFQLSRVAGDFRSTLDIWHMGRKFASIPNLNQDFIEMDPAEIDRIFAVQDNTDELWCQIINNVKATRKLPVFGTPHI